MEVAANANLARKEPLKSLRRGREREGLNLRRKTLAACRSPLLRAHEDDLPHNLYLYHTPGFHLWAARRWTLRCAAAVVIWWV
jgi:hypothetical protein